MQVFILGTGRSGTSIFNRIIGCHADIWSFKWESQIFSGLPALVDVVDTKCPDALIEKFALRVKGHLYKRSVGGRYDAGLFELMDQVALDGLLNELVIRVKQSKSEEGRALACVWFSDSIFKEAAVKESKLVWCEKTPRNLLYADKIQRLYPQAKFINVVRDGREVASSILEKNFWPVAKCNRFPETEKFGGSIDFSKAVRYWCDLMSVTEEMKRRVGPENWLDVRLEDIGGDLKFVQSAFEKFIGVAHDQRFATSASSLVRAGQVDKKRWIKGRTASEISLVQNAMSRYLIEYGYEL